MAAKQPDGNTQDGLAPLFTFLLSPSSVSVVNNFISSRCGLRGGEMFNKLTLELSLAGLNLSKTLAEYITGQRLRAETENRIAKVSGTFEANT